MNDLSAFRQSAAAMRTRQGFDGTFLNFSGETGHWTTGGKDKTIADGRKLVVDVFNLCLGWQKFVESKPVYVDIGFVRDRHTPRPRAELGDLEKYRWRNGVDPWSLAYYLAGYDEQTHQRFIFSTSSAGGKDALAVLQEAFADHGEPLMAAQCPVVELFSESYINSFNKRIHVPLFDIVDWVDQPAFFRAVTPPPTTPVLITKPPLALEANDSSDDFGAGVSPAGGRGDMDDELTY